MHAMVGAHVMPLQDLVQEDPVEQPAEGETEKPPRPPLEPSPRLLPTVMVTDPPAPATWQPPPATRREVEER